MEDQLVLLRTSERSSFTTCRWQWWWGYNLHYQTRRVRPALGFGDLVHQALAAYYVPGRKRAGHPAEHFDRIYRGYCKNHEPIVVKDSEDEGKRVDAGDLGVEMLTNYVEQWGDDSRYEVVASEQTFQVDVHDPRTGVYLFTYVGTFDGIWRDLQTNQLGFAEHKTGASLDPFGAPLVLDEQSSSYWTFGPDWLRHQGLLADDQVLDFILYNRLRKGFRDQRPVNDSGLSLNMDGSVSKKQPAPLFKREISYRTEYERAQVMRRAIHQAREMRLIREGKLVPYKMPGKHCGFCQFRTMCEIHEMGSDWRSILNAEFTKWEPYDAHEIEMERSH